MAERRSRSRSDVREVPLIIEEQPKQEETEPASSGRPSLKKLLEEVEAARVKSTERRAKYEAPTSGERDDN